MKLSCHLQREHADWVKDAPAELRAHASAINGPLWKILLTQCKVDHDQFLHDLQVGFPLLGALHPCEGESAACHFEKPFTVKDLVASRQVINKRVLGAVSELPFSPDILPQAIEDAEQGFMPYPRAFVPADAQHLSLTRRIPVREER